MCGRIVVPGTDEILEVTDLVYNSPEKKLGRINVPPWPGGEAIPIYTDSKPNELQYFHWPLLPYYTPDFKVPYDTLNATVEKLEVPEGTKATTWSKIFGKRHCVIITKGFYEWQQEEPGVKNTKKYPHVIRAKEHPLTLMAGLWTAVQDKAGNYYPSCAMITLPANKFMGEIHNHKQRMPAFLTPETANIWTDAELPSHESKKALEPVDEDFLYAAKISDVKNEEEVLSALTIC